MRHKNRSLFHIPLNIPFIFWLLIFVILPGTLSGVYGQVNNAQGNQNARQDTVIRLKYPFGDEWTLPYSKSRFGSPLYLKMPSNVQTSVEYDPETNQYNIKRKIVL